VGTLTFNNPERHNAMSLEMWRAAAAALEAFESDPAVRVVVLTGAGGKAFVSGADSTTPRWTASRRPCWEGRGR
jgi:enoyl-CoA hydratase/carnithine racemase